MYSCRWVWEWGRGTGGGGGEAGRYTEIGACPLRGGRNAGAPGPSGGERYVSEYVSK